MSFFPTMVTLVWGGGEGSPPPLVFNYSEEALAYTHTHTHSIQRIQHDMITDSDDSKSQSVSSRTRSHVPGRCKPPGASSIVDVTWRDCTPPLPPSKQR